MLRKAPASMRIDPRKDVSLLADHSPRRKQQNKLRNPNACADASGAI
jgi:hypothetical protein